MQVSLNIWYLKSEKLRFGGHYNFYLCWFDLCLSIDVSTHVHPAKSYHKQPADIFVGVIFCIISICQCWPLVDSTDGCQASVPDWNMQPWRLYDGCLTEGVLPQNSTAGHDLMFVWLMMGCSEMSQCHLTIKQMTRGGRNRICFHLIRPCTQTPLKWLLLPAANMPAVNHAGVLNRVLCY